MSKIGKELTKLIFTQQMEYYATVSLEVISS